MSRANFTSQQLTAQKAASDAIQSAYNLRKEGRLYCTIKLEEFQTQFAKSGLQMSDFKVKLDDRSERTVTIDFMREIHAASLPAIPERFRRFAEISELK